MRFQRRQFEFGDEQLPDDVFEERADPAEAMPASEGAWLADADPAGEWEDDQATAELAYAEPGGEAGPHDRRAPEVDRGSSTSGGWRGARRPAWSRLPRRVPGFGVAVGVGAAALLAASLLFGKPAPNEKGPGDVGPGRAARGAPGPAVASAPPSATRPAPAARRTPPGSRDARRDRPNAGAIDAPERRPAPVGAPPAAPAPAPRAPAGPAPVAPLPGPAPAPAPAPPAVVAPSGAEAEFGFER